MKVVAYCRYSTNHQRAESIEAQIRAIKEFCNKEGYNLIDVYKDKGLSGTKDDRPEFLKMIKDSEKDIFNGVIVHKLDRFARNRYDSAFYKKKLKDNNVKLISVTENFDDTPESIILESVLEGMNEYYSKNLSREVLKGMNENALQCKCNGGVIFGYDIDENKNFVINEYEADIVRLIFDLYINNYGSFQIAKKLKELGYKTKRGNNFQIRSVIRILKNTKYIGTYKFKDIEIKNGIPSIIDIDIFNKAQRKMEMLKPRIKENKRNYLLTGFIYCGECGFHYYGGGYSRLKNNTRRYKYYCGAKDDINKHCDNSIIYTDDIENVVLKAIKDNILNDKVIEKITQEIVLNLDYSNKKYKKDIKVLKKKQSSLKKKIDKLFDLYLDDDISKDVIKDKIDNLKKEKNTVEYKIKDIDYNYKKEKINKKDIKKFLYKYKENLENKDYKIKRQLIETFVDKIIVNKNDVLIYLKISDKLYYGEPLFIIPLKIYKIDKTKITLDN